MTANSKTITFRVDDPTYGYFRQLADARAMTMSRFMRYLIVEMANLALNRTETGIGIDEPDCENCKVNHKEYGCPYSRMLSCQKFHRRSYQNFPVSLSREVTAMHG